MGTCECNEERNKNYKQQDYWEAMLQKQEERNDHLSQRRCEMTHLMTHIEEMECQKLQDRLNPCKNLDQQCSAKMQELCSRQTCLAKELSALQQKEAKYKSTLSKAGIVVGKELSRKCQCELDELKEEIEELKKLNMEMMEANRKISDDVEDLQLEYAQYKENVSGPLTRQLEREKNRAKKLENIMHERARIRAQEGNKQLDELYALKAKLNTLVQSVNAANDLKNKLTDEKDMLVSQYDAMQTELVALKLNEAQIIADLANALKELKDKEDPCKCAKSVPEFKENKGPCRPKTCPNTSGQEDADGQAAFGEEAVKETVNEVKQAAKNVESEKICKANIPKNSGHTEMVYEPDGEVPQ